MPLDLICLRYRIGRTSLVFQQREDMAEQPILMLGELLHEVLGFRHSFC